MIFTFSYMIRVTDVFWITQSFLNM